MPLRRCFSLLIMLFLTLTGFTQKNIREQEKLAMQYFEQGEFEKANALFDELYDHQPETWFLQYYKSLLAVKDYTKAEKITRKQLKQNRGNLNLYILLGKIYGLQKDSKKATEYYEKAIKELNPIQPYIFNLANAFVEEKLYDYAIEVYNKGRKQNPDYPFYYERAEIYKAKFDHAAMINEYLDALEFRESELQSVQIQLQNSLGYDDDEGGMKNPLLKQELQKRIQRDPGKIVLSELLIFIMKQQKDFDGAFVQSRALDKRLKEDGHRLFDLARICETNEKWDTAIRCYEYLLEKGVNGAFYDVATIDILNVEFLSVTSKAQPSTAQLLSLEDRLKKAHLKYKSNMLTDKIVRSLAIVQANYLNKTGEAIELLQEFINSPGVDQALRAEFKLLLADTYLLSGDIWEASLLYSQVEKAFKYETIGHEAKFRNARLSYYAGEFAWAKTQADVLKGSVEKLIANDALDLSLIISDAIGVDTSETALRMFSSAELLVLQHRYSEAITRMDSINLLYNTHTLGDDINFKKAQIFRTLGKFSDAEAMYKSILDFYPEGLYGDDAQFKLADLYEKDLNDKEKARQAYQQILTKYPGSIFTNDARKRYRMLRGENVNN
jgi:tetratricopeptide (TPR) repeat protein